MSTEKRTKATWFASSRAARSAKTNAGALKRFCARRLQEFKNHACSNENHPRGGRQFRREAARLYSAARWLNRPEGGAGRHHHGFRERSESGQQCEERLSREVRDRSHA